MKIKIIIAVVIMTIAIVFAAIFGLLLWIDTAEVTNTNQVPANYNSEPTEIATEHKYVSTDTPIPIATLFPTATIPTATPTTVPIKTMKPSYSFASITISTDKKKKTYEIMPDVDEKTLKKNIGWLPGSALPGKEGLCILMGHRDTDFSILQYVKAGDVFAVHVDNVDYSYRVSDIEIVDSDLELRFITMNGSNLVLVTCYPFRYSGHASKKFIIRAKFEN